MRDPLEGHKATLEMILASAGAGIRFNEHAESDGETVFRHACKLGLEGVVSKAGDERGAGSGRSRIMISGPKNDGTYIVEFGNVAITVQCEAAPAASSTQMKPATGGG